MDASSLHRWAHGFRSVADPALAEAALPEPGDAAAARFVETFRDERGNRRPGDRAFLAHVFAAPVPEGEGASPAGSAWREATTPRGARIDAPMFPALADQGIEVWTEAELSALHAFWWRAWAGYGAAGKAVDAVLSAARWHVAELQPDNATQRPWAAHVFALASEATGEPGLRLHAQALVHGSIVRTGRPDLISALILRDAAEAVERVAASLA